MPSEDLRGRRLGGFELDELLGEGAFGSVWRARQLRLERDVAVKVLDPALARDPGAARRFEREGRSAAALDHPAIVPVYEAGDEDGLYYLAMRLVDGETLETLLDRRGPLTAASTAALLAPVAAALDHAHAVGFVHRDVKPSNILIEGEQVYLSDFGIAALTSELGRYTTGSIGTAEYMAPEQARGDEVDGRADLYALGCVAYHAVTGRSPFARGDMVSTMLAHTTDEVPAIGDAGLDAFFARALAKEPSDRFELAVDLVGALEAGEPATVAPGGGAAGGRRTAVVVGVVAALVAVAVAAALVLGGGDDDAAPTPTAEAGDDPGSDVGGTAPPTTAVEGDDGTPSADDDTTGDGTPPADDDTTGEGTPPADDTTDGGTPPADDDTTDGGTPPADDDAVTAIADGGNVGVGTTLRFTSPNPHASIDTSTVLSEWVLPVLFAVDGDLDPVPSLAAGDPQPDPADAATIVWTLRDDVVWDDGTPVTANDVVATYRYLSDPATNATNLLLYESLTAVEARDDTTVAMTFSEPNGGFRLLFSTIHPIIKAAAYDDHLATGGTAADFLADGVPFAAGPYRTAAGGSADELTLVPNPSWSGGADPDGGPHLDRIEFVSYDDTDALIGALERGEVDIVWSDGPGPGDVADLEAIDGVDVQVGGSDLSLQVTFNTARPPFDDPVTRRAVAAAIDAAAVAQTAVGGVTQRPADPLESLVYLPGQTPYEPVFAGLHDPGRAEALLDEAGWLVTESGARTRAGEPLEIDLILTSSTEDVAVALVMQDDLEQVDVDLTGIPLAFDELAARRDSGDWDLYLQTRLFNSDPVATRLVVGTDGCPAQVPGCDGIGVNFGAFSDPAVDELLAAADRETDPAVRADLFVEIDQLLVDRSPALPLLVRPAVTAFDSSLTGIVLAPNRGPLASLADWAFRAE